MGRRIMLAVAMLAFAVMAVLAAPASAGLMAQKGHGHGSAGKAHGHARVALKGDRLSHEQAAGNYAVAVAKLTAAGVELTIENEQDVHVRAMVAAAARVPETVLAKMSLRLLVGTKAVCEWAEGPGCTVRPQGWPAGSWDDADGATRGEAVMLRGDSTSRLPTAPHEIGHAIGAALHVNESYALYTEWDRLWRAHRLSDYETQDGGIAGRQELFADAVADYSTFGRAAVARRYDEQFAAFVEAVLV